MLTALKVGYTYTQIPSVAFSLHYSTSIGFSKSHNQYLFFEIDHDDSTVMVIILSHLNT